MLLSYSPAIDPFYFLLSKDDLSVFSWFHDHFIFQAYIFETNFCPRPICATSCWHSLGTSYRYLTLNMSQNVFIFFHLPQPFFSHFSMNEPTFLSVIIHTLQTPAFSFLLLSFLPHCLFNLDYCLGRCSHNLLRFPLPSELMSPLYIESDFLR